MKLSEDYTYGTNVIRAYSDGQVEINNASYNRSLIVGNTLLIQDWEITHIDQLQHEHWQQLIKLNPEVILIGTGERIIFPHPSTYAPAIESGIGVEFMDTGAACRTYNILLSEDRAVLAGIIL